MVYVDSTADNFKFIKSRFGSRFLATLFQLELSINQSFV